MFGTTQLQIYDDKRKVNFFWIVTSCLFLSRTLLSKLSFHISYRGHTIPTNKYLPRVQVWRAI